MLSADFVQPRYRVGSPVSRPIVVRARGAGDEPEPVAQRGPNEPVVEACHQEFTPAESPHGTAPNAR
jgi:hypothetical protein